MKEIEDALCFLIGIGLKDYTESFENNKVNGEILKNIYEEYLKNTIKMKSLGHRKTFLAELKKFKFPNQ